MSDESKQLSVAELLARNGQQGASSGGGRRRRGGRGISVAELTGDLPVIRDGGSHSAHAAPDDEVAEAPAHEPSSFEPASYAPASYEPTAFEPPAFEPAAPEPMSFAAPDPVAELPNHSPMSGPITRYDPLAPYREATSYPEPAPYPAAPSYPEPTPYPATPSYSDPPPGRSNLVMPGRDMSPGSRHSAPDPLAAGSPYGADALAEAPAPKRSGRRRKPDPDEDSTIVVGPPLRDPVDFDIPRNGRPALDEPGTRGGDRQDRGGRGGRAARRRAAEAEETGPSTAAWAPPSNGFAPDSAPLPLSPLPDRGKPSGRAPSQEPREEQRRSPRSEGGVPSWSARRHKPEPQKTDSEPGSGGIPTAAWSLASQDQQLVSGSTVAGDLLRDGVERAGRAGAGRGRSRGGRAEVALDEGLTDVHDPFLLDDEEDDEDEPQARAAAPAKRPSTRRSRTARKAEYDANRKQWMVLGGQSTGAAVAGMLLFKGFERMWEMLPWVALALAMIVILGLVALVRILRRTDDILSTVIAVVVGIFVTLGPLAFLLSTN
ncbi:hypothetical protein [Nocardia sp. bgisy134]|uniref:hypothetical protein n=1 Tax=Nocardia sp. bgisy134 TaxID=3413789 RepID=UPI003D73D8F9